MSTFKPNDKVVCIDATPIPINARGTSVGDFTFPNGYINEGTIYCVTRASTGSDGQAALRVAGKPIFLDSVEVSWNGLRFRKIKQRTKKAKRTAKQEQSDSQDDIPF